jgi:hypothetical protein
MTDKKKEDEYGISQIIKKWELLRIPYNLVLIVIVVIGSFPIWTKIPDHKIYVIENFVSFVQANILYFSGSFIEGVLAKYGLKISEYRLLIWSLGLFISILLTVYSVLIVYKRY